MFHSNLRVQVQGFSILVAMRGTCFRAKYRKQDAPWLALEEYAGDSEAAITFNEFERSPGKSRTRRLADAPWAVSDSLQTAPLGSRIMAAMPP